MTESDDTRDLEKPLPPNEHNDGTASSGSRQEAASERSSQDDVSKKPMSERTKDSSADKPTRPRSKTLLIMMALMLAVFLAALDISIITTALPTITEHFHSEAAYTWVGSAYLLAVAATTILWGKISDVFGRKPVLLLANGIFFVGSLICALSINVGMLLTARAIQGCGGSGLLVLSNICVGDLFSPRDRGAFYGMIGMVWAVALSLGPIIGGAFTQRVSWRWCFYINLPFDGIAFVNLLLFLDVKTPRTPFLEGLKAIDWGGALLSIGGTLMFLFGMSYGGETHPWKSPEVICLIVFGIVTWALVFVYEAHVAKFPLLPTRIFKVRSNVACLLVCFVQSFVYIAATYYLPVYFQAVLSAGPVLSGVYLLPTAVTLSIASVGTGIYMRKSGKYLYPILLGFILETLGYGLFIDLGSTADWAKIIIFQGIAGFGVGPNFQAPLVALQSFINPRDIASATAAFAFTRNLAGAISVVIGQVVFQNEMTKRQSTVNAALGPQLGAQVGGGKAGANTDIIRQLPMNQRIVVHNTIAKSLMYLWIMYTVVSAAGLPLVFLVGQKILSKEHKETETGLDAENKAREERLKEEQQSKEAKLDGGK